jgi:hypothetical protein
MLPGKVKLKSLPSLNMSLRIRDIFLKKVREYLFVRMLTKFLENMSTSIQTKEAYLPAINVASLDTSGHIVLRFALRSHGSRSKSQQKVNLALNLQSLIMLIRQKWQYPQRVALSCHHCGKTSHNKAECFKLKPHKSKENQIFEGFVSMMKSVLVRLDELDMDPDHDPKVNRVWVRMEPFTP